MPHERELTCALEAAEAAGAAIRQAYESFQAIPDARADISTDADRQSQEIILQRIRRDFPDDALCAEEATPTLAAAAHSGARLWIVDPIDGTRGFAQKNGEFSVMVGFVEDGRVVVGVVLEPALDRLTWAKRGEGCWRLDGGGAPQRCRVTATADLAQATLTQSRSRHPTPHALLLKPARIIETHSAGVKLAKVARGEADLYVNHYPNFHDWDICAGHILVEEAGGIVTTLRGQEVHYGRPGADQRGGLLAACAALHPLALARLAARE
jgi:3'(2'), 5'-bisphosphate nucleotidase